MFIGFQDLAVNSRVNEGLVNRLDFKMKDKLVEVGRQTIYSQRPQIGSYLSNGAPRVGFSIEPGDFAYTKFVLIKTKETFEEKTYSKSERITGRKPKPENSNTKPFSESKIAEIYQKSASS